MLKICNLGVHARRNREQIAILKGVDFQAHSGELVAIVGPSGCGKSTLLKAIAGLTNYTEGQISWMNREIGDDYDVEPEMLAYVPQFGIFHEELTVNEILTDAAILRLGKLTDNDARVREVAQVTGLGNILCRQAKVLSGGQKRRLALAMELVSEPSLILADEVTSGLDPKSSFEITALLRNLASEKKKIVLHITHELKYIYYYDRVLVLLEGFVVFQGPPIEMVSYFEASDPDDLFERLSAASVEKWALAWRTFIQDSKSIREPIETWETEPLRKRQGFGCWAAQFVCLTHRRFRIFGRNRAQIILQFLLLLLFPSVVVLFALKGLPGIQNTSLTLETNPALMFKQTLDYSSQAEEVARLVSGLAMFQVILLALMGANNAARELAAERGIFEKEKLSGLSISAYLASKVPFLTLIVLGQSLWMTILVKTICRLPGDFGAQFAVLGLVNVSLTSLSLAISSWSKTTEQASLIALYVVGFQLPLSGAVLALPDWLATITRPLPLTGVGPAIYKL